MLQQIGRYTSVESSFVLQNGIGYSINDLGPAEAHRYALHPASRGCVHSATDRTARGGQSSTCERQPRLAALTSLKRRPWGEGDEIVRTERRRTASRALSHKKANKQQVKASHAAVNERRGQATSLVALEDRIMGQKETTDVCHTIAILFRVPFTFKTCLLNDKSY